MSASPQRPAAAIPTLRTAAPQPAEFAGTTCYEAGYLVKKNAGWRSARPVVDAAKCTGCLQCWMQCPDGTVYKVDGATEQSAPVAIDYDFCKGCGICVKACRFDAIALVPEREALAKEGGAQ